MEASSSTLMGMLSCPPGARPEEAKSPSWHYQGLFFTMLWSLQIIVLRWIRRLPKRPRCLINLPARDRECKHEREHVACDDNL